PGAGGRRPQRARVRAGAAPQPRRRRSGVPCPRRRGPGPARGVRAGRARAAVAGPRHRRAILRRSPLLMHFQLRYLTEYHYDDAVTDNLNVLRVRPATNRTQRVDDFVVRVEPETRLGRHEDYFGTDVIEFGI